MTDPLAPLADPTYPGNDPAISNPRRYYLRRAQQAYSFDAPEYGGVWLSKQRSMGMTLLPQDFPLDEPGSPILKQLNRHGYTTVEDLIGTNVDELTQRAHLKLPEATAVLAALANIEQQRTTMGYNRGNNPPVPLQYSNTLDLGLVNGPPLVPPSTLTATGNGQTFELGDRGTVRLTATVTAVGGTVTPTLALTLQTSPDGTTWSTVATGSFSNFTTATSQHIVAGPLDRFCRLIWTITGTNPTFAFSCVGEAC